MKTVIVGCGNIATVHAACLSQMENCELVGFADIKKERAEQFAQEYGGRAYTSLECMLEQEEPDVLHICTPHYLHVPMALCGLANHVHVFMEKPPAISKEQLEQLKKAVEKSDKRIGFCFQNRYNPSIQLVKNLLETTAGNIIGARGFVTWNRGEEYYAQGDWRGTWEKEGGGVLINQSIHTLDLLTYLVGKPVWTDARMSNHHLQGIVEVEDTMEAQIRLQEGGNVCFYATTAYCEDMAPIIEIACENMKIRIEEPEVTIRHRDGRVEKPQLESRKSMGKACWGSGHTGCISTFYKALETGERFEEDLEGILDTANLMLALYESAKKEESITI